MCEKNTYKSPPTIIHGHKFYVHLIRDISLHDLQQQPRRYKKKVFLVGNLLFAAPLLRKNLLLDTISRPDMHVK